MKKVVLLMGCVVIVLTCVAQRRSILLNDDWMFRLSREATTAAAVPVRLPHTWNAGDALAGQIDYYRGIGDYEKRLFIADSLKHKRLFLRFDGAFSVTDVFVNGKFIGEHRGGYAAFIFEITGNLEAGRENVILVRVNNAERLDILPLAGDFNFFGGIYRDVHLLITDSVCISPLDYASSGVYFEQKKVSSYEANIAARILVSGRGKADLTINLWEDATKVLQVTKTVEIGSGAPAMVEIPLTIKNPHLWDGVADPFMYKATISLAQDGAIIDAVTESLGLRYFSIDANNGFSLNGKPIKLRGVCRHQDRAALGNALLPENHEEDAELINEIGANAVRLAHYQQSDYFYQLMDKYGIIVWAELPLVEPGAGLAKGYVSSPELNENAKQQLMEMIRQNYNHPSILFWGLFNEVKQNGDDPTALISELNRISHEEDSSRFTAGASNQRTSSSFHAIPDVLGFNKYFGWYEMPVKGLGGFMDYVHRELPNVPLAISEYGAGASIYHQSDSLRTSPQPSGNFHPENWQTAVHIQSWKMINARKYLWGSFVWNMFDFSVAQRREGDRNGVNDKGLVTFDRKTKKDAFYFYKANWNEREKTLYIAGRRNRRRTSSLTEVMIFTNLKEVLLTINGKVIGTAGPDEYGIIRWDALALTTGENTIVVRSTNAKENITDSCSWVLTGGD